MENHQDSWNSPNKGTAVGRREQAERTGDGLFAGVSIISWS